MTDYKATLNLPTTDFPMKANLPSREPEILKFWEETKLYQKLRDLFEGKTKYILHDGPPYANGRIHLGHAVNKTLKDIVVKSKTFSNFDAPFVPGWDCHGLPIELNVEKKVGKAGVSITPEDFLKACREYAQSQIDLQREDFKRLGVFGDWEHPYLTMNFQYEADIIRSLASIIENGHLLYGKKPVHWCTECGSALAEAEVEYKDKESFAIDVMFHVIDQKKLLQKFNLGDTTQSVAIPIWTTTPWTLPANQAVAVNPTHDYVLICTHSDDLPLLVISEELLTQSMARYQVTDYDVLGKSLGKNLEGITLHHPFLMRQVPIVLGDHVTLDAGTGAVHTAPAHGLEDYMVGIHYKLPMDNPVDAKGIFIADTPFFAGEHVFKVNSHVVEVLKQQGNLIHETKIQHSYAHCWRHKTPLIYRATPQWFISMEKNGLREQALAEIKKTRWVPEWGESRIADMIQKRPDWCISRQRLWNSPIPLFLHNETGELHPDSIGLMEEVAKRVEKSGIEAWFKLDPVELLGKDAKSYHKLSDTLDVWFDSGVSHACVLEKNKDLCMPADLYLEGSDQHRGWFQTSLLTSVAMHGTAPYRTVLTHGYTVDAHGHKMSKSLGNVLAPETVIKKFGADVLRLWVATTDYRGEIAFSDEIFERTSEAYRRIRNTARFLLSNLNDFDPKQDIVPSEKMLLLDRWAVDSTLNLQQEIINAYDNFQFHLVTQKIHHFCTVELGSFYLDILKDRLYTTKSDGNPRRSAQTAMYYILEAIVRWIAPILSFTAEEIWKYMPGQRNESVFLNVWYTDLFAIRSQERSYWEKIMVIREAVNKALEKNRNEGKIGSSLAADVTLYADEDIYELLQRLGDELRFVFITSSASVLPANQYEVRRNNEITDIPGLKGLDIKPSSYEKCQRCWHRRADVGKNETYPDICERCVSNIAGIGEKRIFA